MVEYTILGGDVNLHVFLGPTLPDLASQVTAIYGLSNYREIKLFCYVLNKIILFYSKMKRYLTP